MSSENLDDILLRRKKFEINGRAPWSAERKAKHILKNMGKPPKRVRSEAHLKKKNDSRKAEIMEKNRILQAEKNFRDLEGMPRPNTVVHRNYFDLKPTRKKEVEKDMSGAMLKAIQVRLPRNTKEDHLEIASELAKKYFFNNNNNNNNHSNNEDQHDEEKDKRFQINSNPLIKVIRTAITKGKKDKKKTSKTDHNIVIQQASLLLDSMPNRPSKLRLESLLGGMYITSKMNI